ncbi:hypothetical protein CPB85DRAFT_1445570 [Mucidula mucida]|nr:hypothetical protein CPB85DRAFT_1445570 [Mucidula mucida]
MVSIIDNWDSYSRQSLDFASSAAALGFSAAKAGTRLGFSVTRGIISTATKATSIVVDHTLFGGNQVAAPVLSGAVASVITLVEQITLAPIFLSEYITSTSISAAHSSINALTVIFPGSHEASFSLVSFVALVRREWSAEGEDGNHLPAKHYGVTQITRGIIAWVSLQGVTQEWQEKGFFPHLKEIHVREPPRSLESLRARRGSRVRVTSDVIFPGDDRAQIIAADIGEAPSRARSMFFRAKPVRTKINPQTFVEPQRLSNGALKATLRRLSKMVLYGYGGASLLFFGVPLTTPGAPPAGSPQARSEESQLANAINASEAEASGDLSAREMPNAPDEYSWWDVLLGKHDHEIFAAFSNDKGTAHSHEDIVIGQEHLMPRFWVLADHSRGQVVLVIRGTMSLNEIAVDLTCDPVDFQPARPSLPEETPVPGQFAFPTEHPVEEDAPKYQVHGGILQMAKAMGDIGRPVQIAVQEALHKNPDYDLVMCGHSLGAGVASMLGLMWADVKTCRTVKSSGLPVDRRVSVYCFAPPCTTDVPLSKIAEDLIVSFVYSHDVVSRLSIGTVTDLRNAAMWLCDAAAAEGELQNSGHSAVIERAGKWKSGWGSPEDPDWFIAMRKTLEANMRQPRKLYPPGRLWWALRDSDLCPPHRSEDHTGDDRLRLFEVMDVEKVFSQIIFARDMLSAHLPHKYDSVLHDLL